MSECSAALEQLHTTADRLVTGPCPDNMGEDNCGKGWPYIDVQIYLVKIHILHRHGAVLSFLFYFIQNSFIQSSAHSKGKLWLIFNCFGTKYIQ